MTPDWHADVWRALREHDVRQVAYVPDAGLAPIIERARDDRDVAAVPLSSEQEGVAVLAGAWLGGQRGALLMQSSGVGNCVNLLSLPRVCRFPLLMVVTMRGQWGERNPWQVPMGAATRPVLEAAGVLVFDADRRDEVGATVDAAAAMVFSGCSAAAVLVNQRVIGAKTFTAAGAAS